MFQIPFKRRWVMCAALLAAFLSPIHALAEPGTQRDLAKEALKGHLRTSNEARLTTATEQSRANIESKKERAPNQRVRATIFFANGVSSDRLAALSQEYSLDVARTDAKLLDPTSGEAYTVLTNHAKESPKALAARFRASESNARPAIVESVNRNVREATRDFVQIPSDSSIPEMRYYAATVICTVKQLDALRRVSEVMTVVIDDDSVESVAAIERHRVDSSFDPMRSQRVRNYATSVETSSRTTGPASRMSAGRSGATATVNSGDPPTPPGWVGPSETGLSDSGDPDAYKIDLWPDSHYTNCLGADCPNNWTWVPRNNRIWTIGIARYQGGCYLVPSFYYEWESGDDVIGGGLSWYWVEVCYSPATIGAITSIFSFGFQLKMLPIQGLGNIHTAAYHASSSIHCNTTGIEGGIPGLEWPCNSSDINAVYVENSTLEDETKIPNPNCPGTLRGPSGVMNHSSCFEVYQAFSNMPAAYYDTMLADPVQMFSPTIGSADAELFTPGVIYQNVIYFAANSVQPFAGHVANHEFEIGTYWLTPSCGSLCVFKVKEAPVANRPILPLAPGIVGVIDIGPSLAKVLWNNYGGEDEVQAFQWQKNGGPWTSTSASPLVLTGLTPSTTYTILVRAVDSSGAVGPASTTQFTTAPGSIQITGSNGAILPSAASLYNVSNSCSSGQWHTACTWMVRKSYGDFGAVAVTVRAPDGTIPSCTNGTTQHLSSGYVRSGCSLSVQSTVYGN